MKIIKKYNWTEYRENINTYMMKACEIGVVPAHSIYHLLHSQPNPEMT